MDHGQKKFFLKKRPSIQFKRKAGNKQGNWNSSIHEQSVRSSQSSDTEYRILCPSRKIGGVIGKSGSIVNALREETRTKITVVDSVPGSEERVIIICSSALKVSWKQNADGEESLRPHCAAQDALLKVHDRIVEEDLSGGVTFGNGNNFVTARLLVPNNMVGCILGKGGDVIQRLRSETGASIRVLSADHLPTCAMGTEELVQVIFHLFLCFISNFQHMPFTY